MTVLKSLTGQIGNGLLMGEGQTQGSPSCPRGSGQVAEHLGARGPWGVPGLRDPPPGTPSADGPRVPVPPSEGHAGADAAGRAPRSPGFPSAEELGLPQQWRGSVSTTGQGVGPWREEGRGPPGAPVGSAPGQGALGSHLHPATPTSTQMLRGGSSWSSLPPEPVLWCV